MFKKITLDIVINTFKLSKKNIDLYFKLSLELLFKGSNI